MCRGNRQSEFVGQLIVGVSIALVILFPGCVPSHEDMHPQREAERRGQAKELQEEEKRKIAKLEETFNAVYFPPQEIDATSFTYEIQKFFEVHADNTVVFKGYLEDVEASGNSVIVEFACPVGDAHFITKAAIRFRLTVPDNNAAEFLNAQRVAPMFRSLRYLIEPDYVVVSRIIDIQRVRKYEVYGPANDEQVEIEPASFTGLVATGQIIKAVPIPKKGRETP